MTVLVRTADVFAVVKVERVQPVKPDNLVKLSQNTVKVGFYIVAAVPNVAGVKANSELVLEAFSAERNSQIQNALYLLEPSADFTALACHCFEQNYIFKRSAFALNLINHAYKVFRNQLNANLRSLTYVTTGMKVVVIAGQVLKLN